MMSETYCIRSQCAQYFCMICKTLIFIHQTKGMWLFYYKGYALSDKIVLTSLRTNVVTIPCTLLHCLHIANCLYRIFDTLCTGGNRGNLAAFPRSLVINVGLDNTMYTSIWYKSHKPHPSQREEGCGHTATTELSQRNAIIKHTVKDADIH